MELLGRGRTTSAESKNTGTLSRLDDDDDDDDEDDDAFGDAFGDDDELGALNISTASSKLNRQSPMRNKKLTAHGSSSLAVSRPGGLGPGAMGPGRMRASYQLKTNQPISGKKTLLSNGGKGGRGSVKKENSGMGSRQSSLQQRKSTNRRKSSIIPSQNSEFEISDAYDDEGEQEGEYNVHMLKKKIRYFLNTTMYGRVYTNTLVLLSVVSTVTIIVQAYFEGYSDSNELSGDHAKFSFILKQLDLALSVLFFVDWSIQFFLADQITEFLTSFYSMIDVVTVLPTFVLYNFSVKVYDDIKSPGDWLLYIMVALSATRILRSLRLRRYTHEIKDEVVRHLADMVLIFVSMIFFDAALMQFLEKHVDHGSLDFNDWLYYVFVTLATVGYGDISPMSLLGRVAAMGFVFLAVTLVPSLTSSLIEKMSKASIYARAHFKPRGLNSKHVVICGNLDSVLLGEFFAELFHEDHDDVNLKAVIMQPCSPSPSMVAILEDPLYSLHLTYLDGSALNEADLVRAQIDSAIGIFIMTNKNSANPDQEDAKTILEHFCIRRYLSQNPKEVTMCVQLLRPENRPHLRESKAEAGEDLVICLDEIKMGLIAKTMLYPGANTLIFNLLSSFSDINETDEEIVMKTKRLEEADEIDNLESLSTHTWEAEYTKGCDWEIYTTEFSNIFTGAKFSEVAYALYINSGILLIGMLVVERSGTMDSRVLLNPGSMRIPNKEEFHAEAVVIAKNKQSSDLTFSDNDDNLMRLRFQQLLSIPLDATSNGSGGDDKCSSKKRRNSVMDMMTVLLQRGSVKEPVRTKFRGDVSGPKLSTYSSNVSEQERKQVQADAYIERTYFRRVKDANLSDYTVKTTLGDEFPSVSNHFLIIAKTLDNVPELIKPLRAKYLRKCVPIVILCPYDIKSSVWANLSMMSAIFYVRGSGLEENDLVRAGVYKASRVVVLAEFNRNTDNLIATESLVDADAIFIYQFIHRMNRKVKICIEMVHPTNVGYLDKTAKARLLHGYKNSSQFAAGELFITTALDSLSCQAFYNPMIVRVLTKLIGGADHKEDGELGADTLQTPYEKGSKDKKKSSLQKIISSSLYQIPIPALETRTYGSLFQHLSRQGIIPIALYRGVFPSTNLGPKMNAMPYIFTNPQSETEIFSCDQVFVLSQKPQELRNIKTSHISERDAIRENKDHVHSIGKAIEGDVEMVMESQKMVLEKLTHMSEDLEKKVSDIVKDLNDMISKANI